MYLLDSSILFVLSHVLLLVLILIQGVRYSRRTAALSMENISIKNDLNALCRGTTNVDRHLESLSSQIKRVVERQEKLDTSDFVKKEYDHAIRAIKSGASVDRLMNIHGLSQPEARLLVSLHGEDSID